MYVLHIHQQVGVLALTRSSRRFYRIENKYVPFREHQVRLICTLKYLVLTVFSGLVLEKVCEYFYYNEKFKDAKDVPDMDFPLELSLELLMAADYLDGMSHQRNRIAWCKLHLLTLP